MASEPRAGIGALVDLARRLWSVTPPEVQRTVGEKEAISRILIGPGVTLIGPIGAAYMVYRGLLKAPFLFPDWVAICAGVAIELTAFHIGGEMLETLDANRRLTRRRDQRTQAGRSWLTIAMFVLFVVGEIAFIGYMDTWWAFFLPLLSVVNTLTTNERISRFWREQAVEALSVEVLPVQARAVSAPQRVRLEQSLAPGLLPSVSERSGVVKNENENVHENENENVHENGRVNGDENAYPRTDSVTALLALRAQYPKASYAELGRLTAEAVGRPTPYAKSWVAAALKRGA